MMTEVTDQHVAALKAIITDDRSEHERLMRVFDTEGTKEAYFRLLVCAFDEATTMRFRGRKYSDIVTWIAEARTRWVDDDPIDPHIAERLMLWVFGKGSPDDVDFETRAFHETMLLLLILEEAELSAPDLDGFLVRSRDLADKSSGDKQ